MISVRLQDTAFRSSFSLCTCLSRREQTQDRSRRSSRPLPVRPSWCDLQGVMPRLFLTWQGDPISRGPRFAGATRVRRASLTLEDSDARERRLPVVA